MQSRDWSKNKWKNNWKTLFVRSEKGIRPKIVVEKIEEFAQKKIEIE